MVTITDIELMDFVIKNSIEGIIIVDREGKVMMINNRHEHYTGHSSDEYLGLNMKTLVENGTLDVSSSLMVIETGKPIVLEQRIYPDTEDERLLMVKSIPHHDSSGNLEHVVSYIMDITEKSKLINDLNQALFQNEKYIIELSQVRKKNSRSSLIIHQSKAMSNILERANQVARTDATVLITGESGTGKSLLAQYIHMESLREDGSFLSINCGSIPGNLVESELFGYEKGAFSGANVG